MDGTVSSLQRIESIKGCPHFFGIRHLSPAGAYYLKAFLDYISPELVLIEGPQDFTELIPNLAREEVQPPIAVLAYTKKAPVQTLLYPLAEYSPEYQAILWCRRHDKNCRFIDLPAGVFLALNLEEKTEKDGEESFWEAFNQAAGEGGQDDFWERVIEHTTEVEGYRKGAWLFGAKVREMTLSDCADQTENELREQQMALKIQEAIKEGVSPEKIVVITGAYHVEGILNLLSQGKIKKSKAKLKSLENSHTLMPYSYYRLSARSGYGAGNEAPAYFGLLWKELNEKIQGLAAYEYLSRLANWQRKHGTYVSSAAVIEAVRLAIELAKLRGSNTPVLRDLRDAAITCIGEGSFSAISMAIADTEIGTQTGSLPEGISQTSIQDDFYRRIKELKLEKYRTMVCQTLLLDLRENRRVSTQNAAWLDLNRSYFLHCLRVLGNPFAELQNTRQEDATWAENWEIKWSPEAEMMLVEAALTGDTVEQATAILLKERAENAQTMAEIAMVIEDAFTCGMAKAAGYAMRILQAMAVDAASLEELSKTAKRLAMVIRYGSIRKIDAAPLEPILAQMYYRSCLILADSCFCDAAAARSMMTAMDSWNRTALACDFLEQKLWIDALFEISLRDDIQAGLSGFATAILLERGVIGNEELKNEIRRRLSPGIEVETGAGWFEGLAVKNHYTLIASLTLWNELDTYLEGLDDDEFKRALVFLRRAFADFSAQEKDEIAENLGEIWGLNQAQVSEIVNTPITETMQEMADSLDEFSFDDFDF